MLIILTLMISVLVCIKDDSHGVSCIMYLMSLKQYLERVNQVLSLTADSAEPGGNLIN